MMEEDLNLVEDKDFILEADSNPVCVPEDFIPNGRWSSYEAAFGMILCRSDTLL